jgi:hypothetical protein
VYLQYNDIIIIIMILIKDNGPRSLGCPLPLSKLNQERQRRSNAQVYAFYTWAASMQWPNHLGRVIKGGP